MEKETQAQAETTTADTSTTGADTASQVDVQDLIANASEEQLADLLEGGQTELPAAPGGEKKEEKQEKPAKSEAEPETAPEPEKVEAEAGETTAEVETEVEPEKSEEEIKAEAEAERKIESEEEEQAEIRAIQRPRLKDPVDQQIVAVKKAADQAGNPISWAEAEDRVTGKKPGEKTETEEEPVAESIGVITSEAVGTLQAEVDAIRDKLRKAGADEGLVTTEILDLQADYADKVADLKLAKRDLQSVKAREAAETLKIQQESTAKRQEFYDKAVTAWPDSKDKKSKLGKAVAERIAAMRDPLHPDHALLYADSCPWRVTKDVADELGIPPAVPVKGKTATSFTTKDTAAPARKPAPQISGSKTTARSTEATNAGDPAAVRKELLEKGSLEDLDAVQGGGADDEALLLAAH